jgi:hypothetical protein
MASGRDVRGPGESCLHRGGIPYTRLASTAVAPITVLHLGPFPRRQPCLPARSVSVLAIFCIPPAAPSDPLCRLPAVQLASLRSACLVLVVFDHSSLFLFRRPQRPSLSLRLPLSRLPPRRRQRPCSPPSRSRPSSSLPTSSSPSHPGAGTMSPPSASGSPRTSRSVVALVPLLHCFPLLTQPDPLFPHLPFFDVPFYRATTSSKPATETLAARASTAQSPTTNVASHCLKVNPLLRSAPPPRARLPRLPLQ